MSKLAISLAVAAATLLSNAAAYAGKYCGAGRITAMGVNDPDVMPLGSDFGSIYFSLDNSITISPAAGDTVEPDSNKRDINGVKFTRIRRIAAADLQYDYLVRTIQSAFLSGSPVLVHATGQGSINNCGNLNTGDRPTIRVCNTMDHAACQR
jgi:hypothetical protein